MNGDTPLDTEDYEAIASLREEKYALLLAENSELQANLYKAQASARICDVIFKTLSNPSFRRKRPQRPRLRVLRLGKAFPHTLLDSFR